VTAPRLRPALAQAIVREGMKYRRRHEPDGPEAHRQGCHALVEELKKSPAMTTSKKSRSGSISANSDETIGKIIADAMDKVGKEGVITVEDGKSPSPS
jgi:chaperonin GroEL